MKRYFLILLPLLAMWLWSIGFNFYSGASQGEILQFELMGRVTPILEKRYQMTLSSVGGSENNEKIDTISVSYRRKQGPVPLNQGRRMILDCLNEYLVAINSDEKLRPFLSNYPFMPKNMCITIINYEKDGSIVFDPNIQVFTSMIGKIFYDTKDPKHLNGYKSQTSERYEEALDIVKTEENSRHGLRSS